MTTYKQRQVVAIVISFIVAVAMCFSVFTNDVFAKSNKEMRNAAANWAVKIAKDNSFTYGKGARAHHYGCYYCGTNITGPKHAEKGSKWEKTYCNNPFVHAAYAHGAKDKECLKACKNCSGGGTSVKSWTRYSCFKDMGKVKYNKLVKGDILIHKSGNHVAIYVGNNKLAEAAHSGWGKDSIRVVKLSKDRYKGISNVVRYYK